MRLSILIATLGRRETSFLRLLGQLLPQTTGEVEVVAYWNNYELPIGEIRQALLEEARGEYVCFIDDDDDVPDYYCEEILNALGEDYVGFEVRLINTGQDRPRVFHSLKYPNWSQTDEGYYRNVTHLNPIKRSIATKAKFGMQTGGGEDFAWAHQVSPLVKTENYIDKIMYIYHHDSNDSSFGGTPPTQKAYTRPVVQNPRFRYHPASKSRSEP